MQELKFRCWDKRHKEMFYSDHENHRELAIFFDLFAGECTTEVIMQYTGLKDRTGKEIYEGDIVRFAFAYSENINYVNYHVKWCQDIARFIIEIQNSSEDLTSECCRRCVIIGNIYENPELEV